MNAPVRVPGQPVAAGDNSGELVAKPTPFDLSREAIEGLHLEVKNWLDGSGVQSQADADAVSKLLDLLGDEIKLADSRRRDENKPFDEGKAEVQARYATLIGDTKSGKGKAILARQACQSALTPWRVKQDEEQRLAAEAAREAAERARKDAALAFQLSDASDLEAREEAEALNREATEADAIARKAEKPAATGLRTSYRAEVTDATAFARWAWINHRGAVSDLFAGLAQRLCDAKVREMPGVTITPVRTAR